MDVKEMTEKAQELPFDRKASLLLMTQALLQCFIDPKWHAVLVWVENEDTLKMASANATARESLAMLATAIDGVTSATEQPEQGEMH